MTGGPEPEEVPTIDLREMVLAGRGSVTDLSLSYRVPTRPPDILLGRVTPDFLRGYFRPAVQPGTSVFRVPRAVVAAEGAVLADGVLVRSTQLGNFLGRAEPRHRAVAGRAASLERRSVDGDVVLLAGLGHRGYGHWLVDFLPKLHLLALAGHDVTRLRYLLPNDTPAFARAWLDRLGIGEERIVSYDPGTERVECPLLVVPSLLRHGSWLSPVMRGARDFLLSRMATGRRRWFRPPESPPAGARRRILVARSSNAATLGRRELAERAVFEERALARGFEIVRPEAMGIPEQVALFRSAAAICGEYGSGLHGSLFSGPGTRVLSLRDDGIALGFLQSAIDHALDHESGYVVGAPCGEDGHFSMPVEDIDAGLEWLDGPRGS